MNFTEDFISEINGEFSYIDLIPTPCGIISIDDNCIIKANSFLCEMLKISTMPSELENFSGFDFSAMLKEFPQNSENIIKTNTEILNMSDSQGNTIMANIDMRILKVGGKYVALTVFKSQPEDHKNEIMELSNTVPEVYELVNGIFDKLPFMVCIPDNIHNDFIYTNKYAEDFFRRNEANEGKILSLTEVGKNGISGEKMEIDGKQFLMYFMKLKLMGQKILNFIIGIENVGQKKSTARRRAGIDSVSGAYNKAYAVTGLDSLIFKSEIDGSIFSLCYVDVNGLSKINANYGNEVGDRLLKKIVEIIKNNTRRSDYIARMDSDEFMVILPDCNALTTDKIMKNIADLVYGEMIASYDISGYFITYGIIEADGHSKKTAEQLIEDAKQQMIRNKEK